MAKETDVEAELVAALAYERTNRGKHGTIIGMALGEVRRLKAELLQSREAHASTLAKLNEVNDELGELKDAWS